MNAVVKDVYGVSFKVLQNEQRTVFVIPKFYGFFIEKDYVIENFVSKRMQGSINSC